MAKEEKKEPFLGLSWLQLIAGSLAAMTSAWIASAFGVSGTIVGAAVGSLSASIATALYMQSLSHGHRLVRGPNSLGPSASGSSADSVRSPSDATQVLSGGSPADEPDEAGSNSRRNRQIVIGTIVALALALGTIGVIELVSGNAFGQAERPAIGRPWQSAPTETPTPTSTVETPENPTPTPTPDPTEPEPSETPDPVGTPDPTPTASPTPLQTENPPATQ